MQTHSYQEKRENRIEVVENVRRHRAVELEPPRQRQRQATHAAVKDGIPQRLHKGIEARALAAIVLHAIRQCARHTATDATVQRAAQIVKVRGRPPLVSEKGESHETHLRFFFHSRHLVG